jgi:hypothetical protein
MLRSSNNKIKTIFKKRKKRIGEHFFVCCRVVKGKMRKISFSANKHKLRKKNGKSFELNTNNPPKRNDVSKDSTRGRNEKKNAEAEGEEEKVQPQSEYIQLKLQRWVVFREDQSTDEEQKLFPVKYFHYD